MSSGAKHIQPSTIDLQRVDLNLLVGLDALLELQHIGHAAKRLCRSPSATSHMLGRLRTLFDDPLLVREGRQMVRTPRAEALFGPVRNALRQLESALQTDASFEPADAQRTFTLAVHDAALPLLTNWISALGRSAPAIQLVFRPPSGVTEASQDIDLITLGPGTSTGSWRSVPIPPIRWLTYTADPHPLISDPAAYWSYAHLQVYSGGHESPVDAAVQQSGRTRIVTNILPHAMAALHVVASGQALFTGPQTLAPMATRLGLATTVPPIAIPPIRARLAWRAHLEHDPGHRWLRREVGRALGAHLHSAPIR